MRGLLTALPGLGCALMMGGMMWLMSRGNKQGQPPPQGGEGSSVDQQTQLTDLRSEVERLRAELRAREIQEGAGVQDEVAGQSGG